MLDRRSLLGGACALAAAPAVAAPVPPLVTVLGDSLTSGWGLDPGAALPVQLAAALGKLGARARVRGAGVPGDTTAGGLARVASDVAADTRLCVVMLGANDFLLGVEPKRTQANLDAIVKRLKARGVGVVLAGGQAPHTGRRTYEAAFDKVFAEVARRNGVPLAAGLLDGILGRPQLLQADRLHPNAAGVRLMASRLAPVVARSLKGSEGQKLG